MKDRSGNIIERWHGCVIEFGCTTVAKHWYLPKNQRSDFMSEPVVEIDMTLLLGKIHLEQLLNVWYFLPVTQSERFMHFPGGLGPIRWLLFLLGIGGRWICNNYLGAGMGATIWLCRLTLQLRPVGAESHSILPWYVLKSGRVSIADISIVGNLIHLNTLTTKTKLSTFSRSFSL